MTEPSSRKRLLRSLNLLGEFMNKKSMGLLGLTMAITGCLASASASASTVTVNCKLISATSDQGNFSGFDLKINSATAKISNLEVSTSFKNDVNTSIKDDENSLATSTDAKEKASLKTTISGLQELLRLSDENLQATGSSVPYKNVTKSERIRYALNFNSKAVNDIIFDSLAPEADRATLFVDVVDGEPTYDKVLIEYDGSQGPYYDHFECN